MKQQLRSHARKLFALMLLFTSGVVWSQNPCTTPPNCIGNGGLMPNSPASSGGLNMNSSPQTVVASWFVSHGTPSLFGGRINPSPTDYSVWMWSHSDHGEGVFTCYDFQQGQTYDICLWVRNTVLQEPGQPQTNGSLVLEATNSLTPFPIPANPNFADHAIANPNAANRQLIESRSMFNTTWNLQTFTFTANQNFNQLWIYPRRSGGLPQYELQIDDIAISRIVSQNSISVTASPSSLVACQSSALSVVGAPAGSTVSWSPSTGLSSTNGLNVTATPCSTTTYTATVTVNQPNCITCGSYTYTYSVTVNVTPPSFTIVGNPNIICGENLTLSASPILSCPGISYNWSGPNGFTYVGPGFSIPSPDERTAGVYTLTITTSCGTITQTVNVTYACPCVLNPTIQTRGCNPVTFTVTNTTLSTIVGWFWEFGDGETSNLANPTHLYDQNGNYVVCVTVIGKSPRGEMCCTQVCDTIQACGCSAAAPSFTWQPRGTDGAGFTNTSLASAAVCGWRWDFGDGNTSTALNPTHQYAAPGTYTVCLIAYTCYPNASTDKIDTCTAKYCQTIVIGSGGGKRLAGDENTANQTDWQFKLFPNPASTELFVVLPEGTTGEVRLLSADGKELMRLQNTGGSTYVANLKDIAPGMYLIEVQSANATTKRMQFVKE